MAYVANIVTVAEMQFMAGELVDATGNADANHTLLQDYAEAYLSSLVKYDIATNWGTMNAVYKILFSEWAARFAGVELIRYNPAGYTSLIEAEDLITIHLYRMQQIEEILRKVDIQDFLGT